MLSWNGVNPGMMEAVKSLVCVWKIYHIHPLYSPYLHELLVTGLQVVSNG